MIDLNLIKATIKNAALSMSGLTAPPKTLEAQHACTAIEELQAHFNPITHCDDPKAINFDCFAFAWNRLPRTDKFRLIASAYRVHKELFAQVKLDSSVNWDDFNLAQKTALVTACDDMLRTTATLYADEQFAVEYRSSFIGALREVADANAKKMGRVA